MIGNSVIMQLIADGVQWYYLSYDHKAASEEFKHQNQYNSSYFGDGYNLYFLIPDEIKQNHLLWRKGKLRSMRFDPDGMIYKMYIGHYYKYAKCFLPTEVGINVKPILNSQNDSFGLIAAGLAVDEKLI